MVGDDLVASAVFKVFSKINVAFVMDLHDDIIALWVSSMDVLIRMPRFNRRLTSISTIVFVVFLQLALPDAVRAQSTYYVAADGSAVNSGTLDSPWDIQSAWAGQQSIAPGDTLLMLGGTYRHPDRTWQSPGFSITLAGTQEKPITIRPYQGQRVTIDGKVEVSPNSHDFHLWELEITVSETKNWNRAVTAGGLAIDGTADLPQGGLNILNGSNSKFINLVIHDMNSGVGFWRPAVNAEMHGCVIYGIGSIGPDRYHGPGIYTQNEIGIKKITDNILYGIYSTTIQAYGSDKASVSGFEILRNIAFAPIKEGQRAQILVGGGRPSRDIFVRDNLLYQVPLQIGYTAPHNENAEVTGNWSIDAGMSINRFHSVVNEGNVTLEVKVPREDRETMQMLHRNRYDSNRANLAVLNWKRSRQVTVDLSEFLSTDDHYRIVDVLDIFGPPIASGTFRGESPLNRTPPFATCF